MTTSTRTAWAWRRRRAVVAVVAIALTGLVAGCGAGGVVPLRTATPTPPPAKDYDQFMRDVETLLEVYWSKELPQVAGVPYTPLPGGFVPYDPADPETAQDCLGELLAPPGNAFFCPSGFIAYDEPGRTHKDFVEKGDAATAATLAHEIGHYILQLLSVDPPTQWEAEARADCLAGAWLGWMDAQGAIERGDAAEISQLLVELGDDSPTRQSDPNGHGSARERHEAFVAGIEGGAVECLPAV
jgi:predicted metalloprotease